MGYQWQTSTKGLPPKRFQADRLASFKLLRGRWHDRQVTLCACDLLRLDGGGSSAGSRSSAARPCSLSLSARAYLACATFEEPGDVLSKTGGSRPHLTGAVRDRNGPRAPQGEPPCLGC
jgi:hypothetical protein